MPIVAADILIKYSVKTGSAGNSGAGTAAGSLGKYISTTQIPDATLNNLFDDVSASENAASEAEYRCVFVHNAHATLTLTACVVSELSEVAGGAISDFVVDPTAASAIGSASAQAVEVANENTAPAGVGAWGASATLGDIGPGQCRAFWIRRTAQNTAPVTNDGVTFRVSGETL